MTATNQGALIDTLARVVFILRTQRQRMAFWGRLHSKNVRGGEGEDGGASRAASSPGSEVSQLSS